ncbi:hypothetical protein GCM10010400_27900 [Streptomyces aculeolatus]|uniref:hypothetical protein n=1 Tax=Streptomyces aculeolatus TaxID=270689 RepID=UPI001CED34EA|nr:hypothetical protein [Streptomyces aculeolatus]
MPDQTHPVSPDDGEAASAADEPASPLPDSSPLFGVSAWSDAAPKRSASAEGESEHEGESGDEGWVDA